MEVLNQNRMRETFSKHLNTYVNGNYHSPREGIQAECDFFDAIHKFYRSSYEPYIEALQVKVDAATNHGNQILAEVLGIRREVDKVVSNQGKVG